MLFRSFCQHNLQYCDCLVAAYVFRMPVFLPIVYSNAFIQRRLAFKNLFFLFYRLLLDTKYLTISIPISFMLYVFCAIIILIIGPVDHPNREVDSQENRIFIRRTHFTLLFSFLLAVIFAITRNTRYLFLQAIVFAFICITSFIGHIAYKQS